MTFYRHALSSLMILISAFFAGSAAEGLDAILIPPEIRPGDPFVLRVNSNPAEPEASLDGRNLVFGSCGKDCYVALGALGVVAEPGIYEVSVYAGGERKILVLRVLDGKFKTQRITLPDNKVFLSPEDRERTEKEARMLKEIWSKASPDRHWKGDFLMPLENSFSTEFGARRIMNDSWTSIHRGVDIRGSRGEAIHAANAGIVVKATDTFYGGNTLIMDHGLGVYTIYMHMSGFNVQEGAYVGKGDVIGFVGSTGRSTGPHLHYGLKINSVTANPVSIADLPLEEMSR